jgi:ribonuclease HI
MKKVTIYFDGSGHPNPKSAIVIANEKGEIIKKDINFHPKGTTSNEAEYLGLIMALEEAKKMEDVESIDIIGDSQLVVRQVNGLYKTQHPRLQKLNKKVISMLKELNNKNVQIKWTRRENNLAGVLLEKGKI